MSAGFKRRMEVEGEVGAVVRKKFLTVRIYGRSSGQPFVIRAEK